MLSPVRRAPDALRVRTTVAIIAAILLIAACRQEIVEKPFEPAETYRDYVTALETLDLDKTTLGSAWIQAGRSTLGSPADVETPFEETFFFDPHQPAAVAYRFPVRRGRRVTIEIETVTAAGNGDERYFADLFRVPDPEENRDGDPELIAIRPPGGTGIEFEARRDRYYLLRIQPELLRGGRFTIRITAAASLAFPVQDSGPDRILSFYGDRRSGGTRIHEGVDIFAPRGTPLLATSDAVVYRVGRRDRGGKIVSLYDEKRDLLIYYAHLDEQLVTQGQRVSRGDVVGTVGNTGNAFNTPPHLHIGVYQGHWRYPVDPWEYLVDPHVTAPATPSYADRIDQWYRAATDIIAERAVPPIPAQPRVVNRNPFLVDRGSATVSEQGLLDQEAPQPASTRLPAGSALRVVGTARDRVRVQTVHGESWFVSMDQLASPSELSGDRGSGSPATTVFARDPLSGDPIAAVGVETPVTMLGSTGDDTSPYHVIRLESGRIALIDRPTGIAALNSSSP